MIEPDTITIALLVITLILGFLVYFISFKFLIHIIVSVIVIFVIPMNYPFNPFLVSIPEFQFIGLILNGLIYTATSMLMNWVLE